jgi:predicted alpha/beta hydrolase family esterase
LTQQLANNIAPGTYWVSAVSMGCPSMLRWCDKITDPVVDGAHLVWDKNEPDMNLLKECTIVDYQLKPPHFKFSKMSCNAKHMAIFEDY